LRTRRQRGVVAVAVDTTVDVWQIEDTDIETVTEWEQQGALGVGRAGVCPSCQESEGREAE